MLLLPCLQGCGFRPLLRANYLSVAVVTERRLNWLNRSAMEARLWTPLVEEFQRLHPNVQVSLYTINEQDVREDLRRRTARGLGPDLIFLRAPMANTLFKEGLIAPLPNTPSMGRTIAQVGPRYLARVRHGERLAGLPAYDEVTLACYNRSRVAVPPATTEQLMALAASGRTVGLSIDPYGIWWSAGTRGADHSLIPLLLGERIAQGAEVSKAEASISSWLAFLRALAIQSRVDIASGPEELSHGLMEGRLDWIPCFSLTLDTLRSAMGDRLGVTTLPSGPAGRPTPLNVLMVWSFGLDSSSRQREDASAFAQLSVDPLLQRRYVLDTQEVLPVNRLVQTPVASSGVLAALAAAQEQYESGSPLITRPFTMEHLSAMVEKMDTVVQQVMVGSLTPAEGAQRLLQPGGGGR